MRKDSGSVLWTVQSNICNKYLMMELAKCKPKPFTFWSIDKSEKNVAMLTVSVSEPSLTMSLQIELNV